MVVVVGVVQHWVWIVLRLTRVRGAKRIGQLEVETGPHVDVRVSERTCSAAH